MIYQLNGTYQRFENGFDTRRIRGRMNEVIGANATGERTDCQSVGE
jgi:hypothetical protein